MVSRRLSPLKRGLSRTRPISDAVRAQADKGFESLEVRLLAIRHKMKLVAQLFGDFQDTPEKWIPATTVVQEAAEELDEFWHAMDVATVSSTADSGRACARG